jgi:uncharacterized protein (DUF2235 family)
MPKPEPKNIIVLSDGTGNSAAKFNKTNVWRTYEALDLSDPKRQIAYYDDGVGNSSFKPLALLGGALGIGLSRNVRELYAFLCRNYEEGDRIYGFGFSRGAFTIRTLAGFVTKFGLIGKTAYVGDRDLWKKTTWLYQVYRKACSGTGDVPIPAIIIRGLRDSFATEVKKLFLKKHTEFLEELKEIPKRQEKLFRSVDIEFLGLWDTVDAYGLPIDELTMGWDRFVWPLSMRNRDLSAKVKKAVHALSLDDERNSFHPLLWNEAGDSGVADESMVIRLKDEANSIGKEQLSQVWFAGMHANVGGGYADDFLSYVPLNFVLDQLENPNTVKKGIVFDRKVRDAQKSAARSMGVMHDSRSGMGSYYRYLPRKLQKLLRTERWATQIFHRGAPKQISTNVVMVKRPKIHHSVFDRISTPGLHYSPIVLPADYAVVMPNGDIENLGPKTFEKSIGAAERRAKVQERVWDTVWCRRVTYFSTLFLTAFTVLLPWISFPSWVQAWLPFVTNVNSGKCIDSIACPVSSIPKFLGAFLPSYANTWVESFAANPGYFLALSSTIAALMYVSTRLDSKIRDGMHAIWHPAPTSLPEEDYSSSLYKIRESAWYQWCLRGLKYRALPLVFGLTVLGSIGLIIISGASRIYFSIADSYGSFCSIETTGPLSVITSKYKDRLNFNPADKCWRAGLLAQKGATYRIVLDISGGSDEWKDDELRADLTGILDSHGLITGTAALPAKRYVWERYYKPIARIRKVVNGVPGQDEYVLNPTFKTARPKYDCLVSDFTAESSGELFLFVNDAVVYFVPDGLIGTYANNKGSAEFYIKRIANIGEPFSLPPGMSEKSACGEFVFTQPQVAPTPDQ